ncbi:MAG TPA: hypothetical protein VKU01_27105 [Bryobacteraceae bacterium]|nr:hypothetical protein [Bryobacteraceae bacterium]
MAFRTKTSNRWLIACVLVAGSLAAQPVAFPARLRHLHGGVKGTLTFSDTAMEFDERRWNYEEIQALVLSPTSITIRTYEDVRWRLGRDREFTFDGLPDTAAVKVYALLSARLDRRLVAEIKAPTDDPVWHGGAKLLHRLSGINGELSIDADRVVFVAACSSRTWRFRDIDNLSSAGPFELTLTSLDGEARFQLKQALPETRFNEIWRRIILETHHD